MATKVIFFDLGDTLGTAVLSPPPAHLTGFKVFDFVPSLLSTLRSQEFRLGIISNTGDNPGSLLNQLLKDAGILDLFEQELCIYSNDVGLEKDSPEIFRLAAVRAGFADAPESCLFVGENAAERNFAVEAGMAECPHPLLIQKKLSGQHLEASMTNPRELDTRRAGSTRGTALRAAGRSLNLLAARPVASPDILGLNAVTGTPRTVAAAADSGAGQSYIDRALAFVREERSSFGFAPQEPVEFAPDPVVQRTSSGSAAVHLHQQYRGVPIFEMSRTIRFNPQSQIVDAVGDNAVMPEDFSTEPKLAVTEAVLKAAQHLATSGEGQTFIDEFKQESPLPTVNVEGFNPQVLSGFASPSRPTVLDQGPFENPIPAHLVIFNQPQGPRLAWHTVLTFPNDEDQYVVLVSADEPVGEILYSKSTVHRVRARGNVFEFSPGVANRRMIEFPRPLSDYPMMPAMPLVAFPHDWVDNDQSIGNSTIATLNLGTTSLSGIAQEGILSFDPAQPDGDDQKLLNIFYFCNYMHDALFILGFDERAGNFQQINFTSTGRANDRVRARAHSGSVKGTANMLTGVDGTPPLMNMGLVASTGRHTAFDADVVFHEYTHGLTGRLAGGPLDTQSLRKLQSGGMNEGWADYFALTIQNFFRTTEKFVVGDWVVNNSGGIRRAPYDDNFPFGYGDLANFPEEHDIGEVWCAALMMMTRRLRAALGSDQDGYRLAWQIVVDGLKLSPANPTFVQGRDDILRALDDLGEQNRIPPAVHRIARRAAWEAFAHFGVGLSAFSDDADDVNGIIADSTLPADL